MCIDSYLPHPFVGKELHSYISMWQSELIMALHVLSGSLSWHYLCFIMALPPIFCKSIKLFVKSQKAMFYNSILSITTYVKYTIKTGTYKEVFKL